MILRSRRVVTPEGNREASVHVEGGRIVRVAGYDEIASAGEVLDVGDSAVMAGVIDTHVHVNEPGRTEWEGFRSATRAAAAGGVTTILDMPLNSVPATTTVSALEEKRNAARGQSRVHVRYIGGVVPGNAGDLRGLADAGVVAFKCFLTPSGVAEFDHVTERDLRTAFPILAETGLPLMVHAEDPALLRVHAGNDREYASYMATRPVEAEHAAIALMVKLMEWCPTPVHIVHLSSASSLDMINGAKSRGLPLTVETCPHYLTFAAEEIPDGATEFKCAPPIRAAAEREKLWRALIGGEIDLVASDHSPSPPSMKDTDGDFTAAWGGISSLQLSLPAVWTGAQARGGTIESVADWMCIRTARLAGLAAKKGQIAAGYDADIVIWDPDSLFVVDPRELEHRHPLTPYAGMELLGKVEATYVGGRRVFADGLFPD